MPATPPRIRLLPDSLINRIAAGEVVERPAAVLKELMENSLDAGAGRIEIDCEQAGMRLLRVRDDGHGIPPEDLALALCRHATSKISRFEDLTGLESLGFRGEALPSIGAVSRLTLVSRVPGADTAWQAAMEGRADVRGPEPASHPFGTTVEVRDLFFNTPARRRFLRSERTELLHLQEVVRNLALARPGVGIRLVHNRQTLMRLPPAAAAFEPRQRVAKLYGGAFGQTAIALAAEAGGLRVQGWISPADAARNQSDLQTLLVNGRAVRDPRLQHAIRLAYQDTLPAGRYPAYVIDLTVPAGDVDVNVHPAKSEVRFHDPRQVHDFLFSVLRDRLAGAFSVQLDAAVPPAAVPAGIQAGGVGEDPGSYRAPPAGGQAAGPRAMALALIEGQFLIAAEGGQLSILDFRKACAALQLARLRAAGSRENGGPRPLLFPVSTVADPRQTDAWTRHGNAFLRCGFDLDLDPSGSLWLRGVPTALGEIDAEGLLAAIVGTFGRLPADATTDELLAGLAAALPVPPNPEPQAILDEIGRHGLDSSAFRKRFDAAALRRILESPASSSDWPGAGF